MYCSPTVLYSYISKNLLKVFIVLCYNDGQNVGFSTPNIIAGSTFYGTRDTEHHGMFDDRDDEFWGENDGLDDFNY